MKHLWRLRPFIEKYIWQVLLSLLLLLTVTAAQLVIPEIIRQVIDIGLARREANVILMAALVIFAIGLAIAGMNYVQRYLSEWIASNIGYDLRNQMYDHIQYLPFSFHDHSQTGQLISRTIEDVRAIERYAGYGIADLIRLGLLLVGIVALLFFQNARLAAIALLPMLPLIAITLRFGGKIGSFFLEVDNALG